VVCFRYIVLNSLHKDDNWDDDDDDKTKVIPVIIGATGTITKSLRQNLNNVPGKA
jgi:hypothetical protein